MNVVYPPKSGLRRPVLGPKEEADRCETCLSWTRRPPGIFDRILAFFRRTPPRSPYGDCCQSGDLTDARYTCGSHNSVEKAIARSGLADRGRR